MESVIEHKKSGSAIIKVNDPRPLYQAISALNEEYGWVVDYEDPPYAFESELIDVTDPKWRTSHPNATGLKIPAGGAFQFEYEESAALATSAGKEEILRKIVSEYNRSGNPGRFVVRSEEGGRFSVVGTTVRDENADDKEVSPILDTLISIPTAQRSAEETIKLIRTNLSAKSGINVSDVGLVDNLLIQSKVIVGGENVPARILLLQTLNATNRTMIWSLLFDANLNTFYALNTKIAARYVRGKDGTRRIIPIDSQPIIIGLSNQKGRCP
ncbi:MAG: hypothetical protein M3033_07980 [Acidobacteriota bacterium]|nr:hypothetical protein [Acidobacteriota bacterium]